LEEKGLAPKRKPIKHERRYSKMRRLLMGISIVVVAVAALVAATGTVMAAPPDQANHGNDFVCPVITSDAMGMHNPNAASLGEGTFTVGQPTRHFINVPDTATNGDGYGIPGVHEGMNAQSRPGDSDYAAIWNGEPPMEA